MPVATHLFAGLGPRRLLGLAAAFGLGVVLTLGLPLHSGPSPEAAVEPRSVVREVVASTAQLVVEREGGGRRTGSSVVLERDSATGRTLLVTAAHVLTPVVPQEVRVLTPLRQGELAASVLAIDEADDLALIEVEGLDGTPARLAAGAMLGDDVYVAAFPWGRRATLVRGMVSQIDWGDARRLTEVPLGGAVALIDASVSHGMSGGGVFDRASGALLGIVRGYRSAEITLPGAPGQRITLPVAGETTVVPTTRILCFLGESGHAGLAPAHLGHGLGDTACP